MYYYINSNELYHHGVLGMKWGIRRYQPYRNGERKGKEVGEAAKAKSRREQARDTITGWERQAIQDQRDSDKRWMKKSMNKEMQKAAVKNVGRGAIEYIKNYAVGAVLGTVAGVSISLLGNPIAGAAVAGTISRSGQIRGLVKGGTQAYVSTKNDFSDIQKVYNSGSNEISKMFKESSAKLDKEMKASNESEKLAMNEYDRLIKEGTPEDEATMWAMDTYEQELRKRGYAGA